ncbi:hypothetical protein [Longispora urticae]
MSVLDVALGAVDRALAFLPADVRVIVVLPVLFLLVLLLGSWAIRYVGPLAGSFVNWCTEKAALLAGLLLLLPELAVTTGFRRAGLRPPAVCYAYGEFVCGGLAVVHSMFGAVVRTVNDDRKARLLSALLLASLLVMGGNTCEAPPPRTCVGAVTTWWNAVTGLVDTSGGTALTPAVKQPGQ